MVQTWDVVLGVNADSVSFEQVHAKFRQLMMAENLDVQQVLLLSQAYEEARRAFEEKPAAMPDRHAFAYPPV